ncbi:MAG: hypothetical protein WD225_10670, partial [Ilumatobacteraceae bacterium]
RTGQRFCAECGAALIDASPDQPVDQPVDQPTGPIETVDATLDEPTGPMATVDTTTDLPPTQPVELAAAFSPPEPSTEEPPVSESPTVEHGDDPAPTPAPVSVAPRLYDLALDEPDLLRDPAPAPVAVTTEQLAPPPASPATAPTTSSTTASTTSSTAEPATEEMPVDASRRLLDTDDTLLGRFRIGVVSGIGIVTGMTALFGVFLPVVAIRTNAAAPAFATGDWMVADLGTNLPGALIVTLVALLVGVVGAGFRQRWAAGLAGGAGLALAGWVTLVIGLAERPVEAALDAVGQPTTEAFTVTITRDVGYWVLLAAGALGVLTFVVSLASAGRDRSRRGLNPWIASLGAVAAVIAAAGPLLPEGAATVQDNWSPGSGGLGQPVWYVIGRLVQLGLLAYTGVIGFLLVRSYGLGLAIGGMSASVWLALATLVELGGAPIGPGFANPGASVPVDLHAVTIVGMTALVGLVVVAVIAAIEQSARDSA